MYRVTPNETPNNDHVSIEVFFGNCFAEIRDLHLRSQKLGLTVYLEKTQENNCMSSVFGGAPSQSLASLKMNVLQSAVHRSC